MTIDLDALQKLLDAATSGPLSAIGGRLVDARGDWIAIVSDAGTDADMRWIAAAVNAAPALIDATRERDAAVDALHRCRVERDEALADLSALRLEHEAHTILLDCARRDRDEARARVAELESWNAELRTHDVSVIKAQARGFEAGVKAAANVVACAPVCPTEGECYACDRARDILALLEPKP